MAKIQWNHDPFKKAIVKKAVDGLEEWCIVEWLPAAKKDCPVALVNGGTMRNSLTYERNDAKAEIYVGGGGAAKAYIKRQEMDRSLHHHSGQKAGFIQDNVKAKSPTLSKFVQKHINK